MSSRKSHNALITGAAKRIGREIAISLAKNGWNVAVHHNSTSADEVLAEVKKYGVKAIALKADLNNVSEAKTIVAKANAELGEISLLINNASIFEKIDFANSSEDVFDRNFNIHVKSPFFLAQEFAKQTKAGQVINIVDSKITKNKTAYFAYLLSKKSLSELTHMLAVELAPNIRVNAILPGVIDEFISEKDREYCLSRKESLPLKRFTIAEELTNTVLYLADSTQTGQVLTVDSGEYLI